MAAFIVLTRLSYQALNSWRSLADLSGEIMKRIRDAYAGVELTATYVVLDCGALAGYVDIFTAPLTMTRVLSEGESSPRPSLREPGLRD